MLVYGNEAMGYIYGLGDSISEDQEIAEFLFENGYPSGDSGMVEVEYQGAVFEVELSLYSDRIKAMEDDV